jgi:hypothetical protein
LLLAAKYTNYVCERVLLMTYLGLRFDSAQVHHKIPTSSTLCVISDCMKTIDLTCENCGASFAKELREYRRQTKRGRTKFFCTQSCATIKSNKDSPHGNPKNLQADNRKDEYTPFRWFILRAEYRDRKKNYGCDLTVEFLKQLWDHQAQTCPFTGWTMILPQDTNGWVKDDPANASLDRIDNSKGYTQDNVRFISLMANYARNTFTDSQLFAFCRSVVKRNPNQ